MKIKSIRIENFRSVKEISIDFSENLNVLVGINGSGKTTILDALASSLSWLVNRIQRPNASAAHISESDIRYETTMSSIKIAITEMDSHYQWRLVKGARGINIKEKSALNDVSELASHYQEMMAKQNRLPVIAYYPVSRVVEKTTPEIGRRENLFMLDVYDNALGGKRNYQSFFEWFRIQDDILNEKATSRRKWILQNSQWIKERVKKLIDTLKNLAIINNKIDLNELNHLLYQITSDESIYVEPRFLFHELARLIKLISFDSGMRYDIFFYELEYQIHKLETLSRNSKDGLIDAGKRYHVILNRTLEVFEGSITSKGNNQKLIETIWEIYTFANIISLWWISERGKINIDRAFKNFSHNIDWKDSNWEFLSVKLLKSIQQIINLEITLINSTSKNNGKELESVVRAIEQFVPEYTSLRVKRVPRPHMLINKRNEEYNLDQLSEGEKNLITLVGDIARRLAIANPFSENPLKGEGVILIDEIDLHLHPKWQRLMIPQLLKTFPNCQFVITTHSPQVISHVKPENLFLLEQKNNCLSFTKADETYGMSIDRVVELIMHDEARPVSVQDKIDAVFELIERKQFNKAKEVISLLKKDLQSDPEILRAEMLIRKEEYKA